ncbi:hypothetical protein [Nocardia sp. NPDC051833]|uniref:hypothetical protein n=1 Tax=Nocardia sp. NPDC051833 TaxID=3155674 RepID=UPI00343BE4B4
MGQSPSADVYFGYDLGEFDNAPDWVDEHGDWEHELALRLGWTPIPFPDDYPTRPPAGPNTWNMPRAERDAANEEYLRRVDEYKRTSTAYEAYQANTAELERLRAEADVPVFLDRYGSLGGEPGWSVCVAASGQSAPAWGSKPLRPLVELPEWRGQLARFIELLGLDVGVAEPGWHLNCSYG